MVVKIPIVLTSPSALSSGRVLPSPSPASALERHFGYGGDFGAAGIPTDEAFCINGLFQPDRLPNPHAWEAKQAQQPVAACAAEAHGVLGPNHASLLISNRFDFLSLDDISADWTLTHEEQLLRGGQLQWLGRGPHESYSDRYASARVGEWGGSVAEQTFRYVRPQAPGASCQAACLGKFII